MKILFTQVSYLIKNKPDRRNLKLLLKLSFILLMIVVGFSVIFHLLMLREGRDFSWVTGFYWTLTVMSTLGFGDITFISDWGRFFSIVVLITGMLFLLILFPFTFINFFYAPWMNAQIQSRVPRVLPDDFKGHVILTQFDPVTEALIKKLKRIQFPYVVLVQEFAEGLRLREMNINVMLGDIEDPQTYLKLNVEHAALVATTAKDIVNTSVAFTVRGITQLIPIIATCNEEASEDILQLAGANHVLRLGEIMGLFLARRASGGDAAAQVIGRFEELNIAEALVAGSSLVGKKIGESRLREKVGVSILGVWERGKFQPSQVETVISENTVLVLAGTEAQIKAYNRRYCVKQPKAAPLVILGGGRVGRATGKGLAARGLDYRIVEKLPNRVRNPEKYVLGDAAEYEILQKAGIETAPSVIVSTHEDDVNVYLTIYCRKLRPDIQVITRATLERNLATMHRAGADFVLSYASMGANAILNLLKRSDTLMVAEGLDLLKVKVPTQLVGQSIADTSIRKETGCTIIAIKTKGSLEINPDPSSVLPKDGEIILIGTTESEDRFFKEYGI